MSNLDEYDKTYSQHMTPKDLIASMQQMEYIVNVSQKAKHNISKIKRMVDRQTTRGSASHGVDLQPRTVRDRLRAKLASK